MKSSGCASRTIAGARVRRYCDGLRIATRPACVADVVPHTGGMRIRLSIVALAALISCGSCSFVQFAYNRADWYVVRKVAHYTCPDRRQRAMLRRLVSVLHRWHRRHELSRYARDLRRIAKHLERPVTRAAFDEAVSIVEKTYQRTMKGFSGAIAMYGAHLGARQVRCVQRATAKYQRERREKLGATPVRYRAEILRKIRDALDDWIGDLTATQLATLAASIEPQSKARAIAHESAERAARFIRLLQRDEPIERKRALLSRLATDRCALMSRSQCQRSKRRLARREEKLWQFARLLTAAQRRKLREKLLGYAADFEELAAE